MRVVASESVTNGHPDKIADQISDAVLDAVLEQDPNGRVACECAITRGTVFVFGEITTDAYVDVPHLVREVIHEIGYTDSSYGFDSSSCGVLVSIDDQSPDIAAGVNPGGAGDQGMMYGFACNETPQLMPLPIQLAHELARTLTERRKDGTLSWARPDGKTQVTVTYDRIGHPVHIENVLVSSQHNPSATHAQIFEDIQRSVVDVVIPEGLIDDMTQRLVNPTGRFVVGGPVGDSGLTGRKIIVDTYGGYARHGGGAFSGKDPTKVDRSASYAARWVAKNIVAAGLASHCEVMLAYAIGMEKPLAFTVDTFGTEQVAPERIVALVEEHCDLTPRGIIDALQLRRPMYRQVAAFGHFGRTDCNVPWERLTLADAFARAVGSTATVGSQDMH